MSFRPTASRASPSGEGEAPRDDLTVEDHRFAIVPEWIIDAPLSDCAFRVYAVLLRYGQTSGQRMPSRATLARRLHKRSVDTVDRAMKELVALGAVVVERRRDGSQNLTNRYHVRTSCRGRTGAATPAEAASAAPVEVGAGPIDAATGGHETAARVAAPERPDLEHLTESTTSHPQELAEACRRVRRGLGLPDARWSSACLHAALLRAGERGWPPELAERALLAVAADPDSRSPMRVAEAGPWWDQADRPTGQTTGAEVAELERVLDGLDGFRALLQRDARIELTREGAPLTRSTVVRRAVEIYRRPQTAADLPPAV